MNISYKSRLIWLTLVFVIISSLTITIIANNNIRTAATHAFAERGISVVYKAKAVIDAQEFQNLVDADSSEYEYYDDLYARFFALKKEQGCKFLYAMVPVEGNNFKYIVDGTHQFDEEFSPYGTVEDISSYGEFPHKCLETQEIVVSDIIEQEGWGWTISVYAPIINEGKSIGFVACDYDVGTLVSNIKSSSRTMIFASVLITIVGMLLITLFISSFFKKLNAVTQAMHDISSGARDLTQRLIVKGNNELDRLSTAYNDVIAELQEMVRKITKSIKALSENSNILLSQNTENLNLIENAKMSIGEIYEKADNQNTLSTQVSNGISGVETAVKILDEKIVQQSQAVEKSSLAVEEINSSISAANETIERISNEYAVIVKEAEDGRAKQDQVSEQVDLIVRQAENLAQANAVISSIASQTNLLAMNAAIEAAHAGESGKGFSVVADEIRKLAENSAAQSTAVNKLIDDIEQAIHGIVTVSESSSQSFASLGEKIQGMDSLLGEIKNDMSKENLEAQNILDMMTLLSNATSGITESSEQMKNNTMAVVKQIEELKESSQAILESGNNANDQLIKMNDFASETATQASENADLTSSVDQIVSSYKVEES